MADNDNITIVGSVGFDPDYKVDGNGLPRVMLRVASDQWQKNRESGNWEKGEPNWYSVVAFRFLATNAAASLHKGERIIVTGSLKLHEWIDANGVKRVRPEIIASSIGHDLNWGTSSYTRPTKSMRLGTDESQAAAAGEEVPSAEAWSTQAPSGGGTAGEPAEAGDEQGETATALSAQNSALVGAAAGQDPVF